MEILDQYAEKYFGIKKLFPAQKMVISNILEGRDQIVLLPTGSGKSLCFQLPVFLQEGLSVIIYPLLALMADQQRRMQEAGIPCAVLKGGMSQTEKQKLWQDAEKGEIKIIITNPETLMQEKNLEKLQKLNPRHFVLDEAHVLDQWGLSFREAYLKVKELSRLFPEALLSAFTATAGPDIVKTIRNYFFEAREPLLVSESPDRPNIHYQFIPVLSKARCLISLVKKYNDGPLIVFFRSREGARLFAHRLKREIERRQVFFYHAGLSREEKKQLEEWFFQSEDGILCSTNAYGMGVDKKNIRTVIHFDLSNSIEAYLQESGRGGRDREKARAIALYSEDDKIFLNKLSGPLDKKRFQQLYNIARNFSSCRRNALLKAMNAEKAKCGTCDVCQGQSRSIEEYMQELALFFQKNGRLFSRKKALAVLHGRLLPQLRKGYQYYRYGFGLLSDWSLEDIDDLLLNLERKGKIQCSKIFFWRKRLIWKE